jgi:hypothetical protein
MGKGEAMNSEEQFVHDICSGSASEEPILECVKKLISERDEARAELARVREKTTEECLEIIDNTIHSVECMAEASGENEDASLGALWDVHDAVASMKKGGV